MFSVMTSTSGTPMRPPATRAVFSAGGTVSANSAGSVLGVIGALGLALLGWLVRGELRERRSARAVADLARKYRQVPPARKADAGRQQKVTVAQLVARMRADGSAATPMVLAARRSPGGRH
jgi:hypothetical protein